jgi:SAM-dependent methyltransferase
MPVAYYSVAAEGEFWTEHWGRHDVASLLALAERSPLSDLIVSGLDGEGIVLEAGCGLGQYVLYLRRRGYRALGADWSLDALRACRRHAPDAALAAMDLRRLAVRSASVATYISLGVVEHDPAGPDAIVAEAARVLRPRGRLLLSVPYVNGVRRVTAPYLALRGRRIRRAGGRFYQFAFTRREVAAFLRARGFEVRAFRPYDPARMLRAVARAFRDGGAAAAGPAPAGGASSARRGAGLRGVVQALLYTPPALRLLGHMLMAVAVKR